MATHGVDAFIENYKKTILSFIEKMESMIQLEENLLMSSKDQLEDKVKTISDKILQFIDNLKGLWSILFLLDIHMQLAIENDTIVAVAKEVDKVFGIIS
jgi:hypothetical protein